MKQRKKDRHLPQCVYQKHGAYWYVKGGKWRRLGKTLSEAMDTYARIIALPTDSVSAALDEQMIRYEAQHERGELAASTIAQYRTAVSQLKPIFAEFSLHDVTATTIYQWMDHYADKKAMANRMRTVLQATFDHAVRMGKCANNPVMQVKRHAERKRDRYLTDKELAALLEAASPTMKAIIMMCYLTGQRIGDVLAIKLDDITDDGILFRQGKTGKRLLVKMYPALRRAVAAAKALPCKGQRTYLLCQPNGKKRLYKGVYDLFMRTAEVAGVEDVTPHDLRAKAITDAERQGLDSQKLGGHTTKGMTLRYIRDRITDVAIGPEPSKILDSLIGPDS